MVKEKFIEGQQVMIVSADFSQAAEFVGQIGTIKSIDENQHPTGYLVCVGSKSGWWYLEKDIQSTLTSDFNAQSQEDKTIFIRNIVGQLYLHPTAYLQYKRLYDQIDIQHSGKKQS